jgi:ABC-type molybdate transport system permease subunit
MSRKQGLVGAQVWLLCLLSLIFNPPDLGNVLVMMTSGCGHVGPTLLESASSALLFSLLEFVWHWP